VAGSSIHIHSSTPPAYTRLSTLSSNQKNGYRKPITALSLSPTNALQLISASEDGTVKVWDWVEGRLIRSIVFSPTPSGSLRHMCLGAIGGKWWIFGIVSEPKEGKEKKGKSEGVS
jgi:NET1-associated nuclear protein 1 (U3 small nucleolar RNA-associated protein 17)